VNPLPTTTTTSIKPLPSKYQGVYSVKHSSTARVDRITLTATTMKYELSNGGTTYTTSFEGEISYDNNIVTVNIKKFYVGELKTLPIDMGGGSKLTSYVFKFKFEETLIGGKTCYYITHTYTGGDINTLLGEWKNEVYVEELKYEMSMGGNTFYAYDKHKLPVIRFTNNNKILFHGYKYGMTQSGNWTWFNIDLTADVTIDTTNKTMNFTNMDVTTDYNGTITQGYDYPNESVDYKFEKVNNSLVISLFSTPTWGTSNDIFYLEKQ